MRCFCFIGVFLVLRSIFKIVYCVLCSFANLGSLSVFRFDLFVWYSNARAQPVINAKRARIPEAASFDYAIRPQASRDFEEENEDANKAQKQEQLVRIYSLHFFFFFFS